MALIHAAQAVKAEIAPAKLLNLSKIQSCLYSKAPYYIGILVERKNE